MIPKPTHQFKMVLVGDSAVGKSSILNRFVDDQFTDGLLSTIGVDFKFRRIKIDERNQVKLQIWDTAGQQAFRAIVSAYYNSADAIIIVYDITSQKSFEVLTAYIQSVRDYWINQVQTNNKHNALVFLMANKIDQPSLRKVQTFSVQGVCDSHQINKHFQVSAKNGTNIEQSFRQVACKLIKKSPPSKQKHISLDQGNKKVQRGVDQQANRKKCCMA